MKGTLRDIVERKQPGAQTVVDVMRVIGDVVGKRRRLRLGAGEGSSSSGKRASNSAT